MPEVIPVVDVSTLHQVSELIVESNLLPKCNLGKYVSLLHPPPFLLLKPAIELQLHIMHR